jgi:hypothetical protein
MELTQVHSIGYYKEFITSEKENEILNFFGFVNDEKNKKVVFQRNKIMRFGLKEPYHTSHVSNEIPFVLKDILPSYLSFTSVSINEYFKGQFIDWHIDLKAPNNNDIYILSLCNEATIKFRNTKNLSEIIEFELEPRSLSILTGELRNNFEHMILPCEDYRISIVFR